VKGKGGGKEGPKGWSPVKRKRGERKQKEVRVSFATAGMVKLATLKVRGAKNCNPTKRSRGFQTLGWRLDVKICMAGVPKLCGTNVRLTINQSQQNLKGLGICDRQFKTGAEIIVIEGNVKPFLKVHQKDIDSNEGSAKKGDSAGKNEKHWEALIQGWVHKTSAAGEGGVALRKTRKSISLGGTKPAKE